MSEYQHYEFRAIERPLTAREQSALRQFSSRATISPGRFAVDYSWGDFKGDASEWMEKYFDAFLHVANWGTHELMLRLPRTALPLETARRYCAGDFASARVKGEHLILAVCCDDEEGEGWIDEDDDSLSPILPVRDELSSGDLRALYLVWLGAVRARELDEEDEEPPCPPGLGELSPALEALASFLRVDTDLIEAAATASPKLGSVDGAGLEAWVAALPEAEKTSILVRLVGGSEAHVRGELLRRFRESVAIERPPARARKVGELLKAAEERAAARSQKAKERAAREKERREREAAEARDRHLSALAVREEAAWIELDALIATRLPKKYDEAVVLLRDLRDLCARAGRQDEAARRIARLREEHSQKRTLIERIREAGLID